MNDADDSTPKSCTKCKQEKTRSDFHNDVTNLDGKNGRCKRCVNEANAIYRAANRDKVLEGKRNYALNNAQKIREKAAGMRRTDRYQAKMKEYRQQWNFAKRYGVTVQDYERLYEACNGLCEVCDKPLSFDRGQPNRACIDHNHDTGEIRGILCRSCNIAIGILGDSSDGLRRAIAYLEKWEAVDAQRAS